MEQNNTRVAGIDLIKTVAVLFVIFVHFFLNTNYYKTATNDANMIFQSWLRWVFLISVPLFIITTGYLNRKKVPTVSYYLKLIRVILIYIVISIMTVIVKVQVAGKSYSLLSAVFDISRFNANSYGWYINMYIGLFILAPFLNAAVEKLERKGLFAAICILAAMISLPTTFNPLQSRLWFPDWWSAFYPVMYYLIGAYVSKYRIKASRPLCALVFIGVPILETLIQVLLNMQKFNNWAMAKYGTVFNLAASVAFFLLVYPVDIKTRPVNAILRFISSRTLEIYLFNNILNIVVFKYFRKNFFGGNPPLAQQQIFTRYFIPTMLIVTAGSVVSAAVFRALYDLICKGAALLIRKIPKKQKKSE